VTGSRLPVPLTVDCTTPSEAVTTCVSVRAELDDVPNWPSATTTTTMIPAAITAAGR
jgi:hypothetical protein